MELRLHFKIIEPRQSHTARGNALTPDNTDTQGSRGLGLGTGHLGREQKDTLFLSARQRTIENYGRCAVGDQFSHLKRQSDHGERLSE
ncbi:hypothetical protein SRHO_G00108980 [Serrasalmus rhombeus]